jgi:hypothetical protein
MHGPKASQKTVFMIRTNILKTPPKCSKRSAWRGKSDGRKKPLKRRGKR